MSRIKYIEILKEEFAQRRSKNSFYSLRSFAKDLGLNPMHLSNIFNNKRGLSKQKAEFVARELRHLNFTERRKFILLVSAASGKSRLERNFAKMGLRNLQVGWQ